MAQIDITNQVLTLVNVFTVDPGQQEQLANLLVRATQETMRHQPGFVSANIHRSLDGHSVINYAQWRDQAAFDAMLKNPEAAAHMQQASALAKAQPMLCTVVESIVA